MKIMLLILVTLLLMTSNFVEARDDRNRYSIDEAMNLSDAKAKLNEGYTYRFGTASHNDVVSHHGEFKSNKKTNAVGKSDKFACQWAFLSAMLTFQNQIGKQGGNAVINIRSYYKKIDYSSETEFECGNGALMAGVTLVGDIVTLKD